MQVIPESWLTGWGSEEEEEKVYYIARMHDIFKIGIPDSILNEQGKLTEEKFAIMRSHTEMGGDIFKNFTSLTYIGDDALSHHERFDGSGYPENKGREEKITFFQNLINAAACSLSHALPR